MDWRDKKVLVLGLGKTGYSCARWLAQRGAQVTAADSRELPPQGETLAREFPYVPIYLGPFKEALLREIEALVLSPGIAQTEPLVAAARARKLPIMGDVELFALELDPKARVLAITGTNGKSTVVSMAGDMCREAGLRTVVAGNIGLPALDGFDSAAEVYVLELSSFQLETTLSLNADAATVLNVTEDHLDRHLGLTGYARAKSRIFRGKGIQVLNRQDAISLGMALKGRRVFTFGLDPPASDNDWGFMHWQGESWLAQGRRNLIEVNSLAVSGLQNAANALAALALCRAIGLTYPPLLAALKKFQGLPHRLQKVRELNGVVFFDDSKGTNVGATTAALSGMSRPVVLIAGGDGKGQDFSPLSGAVKARARAVVLIGRDRERIAQALASAGVPTLRADGMREAVILAHNQALPGDAVLLSPACASFDMFRDYEHRAEVFVAAVRALRSNHDSEAA
ncbi:MAG TPA: UDP-N-acetylmuramoyl-L-alanine--D-glutamate ligase [Burkholderiales bacterium]|nr:UDP-N-acetylmuramoyl-L-alanine--D-glutamate ligase [Burkholderiales bacterium]